jgi:hypothetical protein
MSNLITREMLHELAPLVEKHAQAYWANDGRFDDEDLHDDKEVLSYCDHIIDNHEDFAPYSHAAAACHYALLYAIDNLAPTK